jgi:hypothetical protein
MVDEASRREDMLFAIVRGPRLHPSLVHLHTDQRQYCLSINSDCSTTKSNGSKNQVGRTVGYIPGLHKIVGVPTV